MTEKGGSSVFGRIKSFKTRFECNTVSVSLSPRLVGIRHQLLARFLAHEFDVISLESRLSQSTTSVSVSTDTYASSSKLNGMMRNALQSLTQHASCKDENDTSLEALECAKDLPTVISEHAALRDGDFTYVQKNIVNVGKIKLVWVEGGAGDNFFCQSAMKLTLS